ncbi:MAG: glycosyltransferase family 2 protein [Chthoniobacterales bacterium]
MTRPAISVVIATYNRSRALACAIESVLRQTFTNWELIVVGDACTDDTAEVVAGYLDADARVRFVNLERNWGEQSGPNNVGRTLARAPLIAYLSHDDLWLPHHLKTCSEALAANRADLVLGTAANIFFEDGRLAFDSLHVLLQGMGEGNRWSPADLDASVTAASCWLIRTDTLDKLGGWRMSQEERAEPSQALLFRLWRRGFRIHGLNDLTLVIVTAGNRPTSYLERETPEHEWILQHIDDPAFPAELAARMPSTNLVAERRSPRRPAFWKRAVASALAAIGINPRIPSIAFRHGWSRGAYLRHLRESLGLPPAASAGAASAVRAEAVQRSCDVTIGMPVDFGAGGGGARYLASGWSHPEIDGVWSDGSSATLLFDVGAAPTADLRFDFSIIVFRSPDQRGPREAIIETTQGHSIARWTLSASTTDCSLVVPKAAWMGPRVGLRFQFDEPISPSDVGASSDRRALSVKLRQLWICEPSAIPSISGRSQTFHATFTQS